MNKIEKILAVGADPEVMLFNKEGVPHSSEGLLGGSKENPRPILGKEGFFVQEDNVSAEFNIPPATNDKMFSGTIKACMEYINKEVSKHGLHLECKSAVHFPMEALATPHAQRLGCEPDFNAWTTEFNPRPMPPHTLRTAAGHVHISWAKPEIEQKLYVVRALDLLLSVPSILATEANERRSLYGRAGACRLKDYGVEHRTLDNFWLADDENRRHVYNTTVNSLAYINQDTFIEELDEWEDEIQNCINTHDKDQALHLMQHFKLQRFPVSYAAA